VGQLEIFEAGAEVTPETMLARGLVRSKRAPIKILADGVLTKPLTVKAHGFSAKAQAKINSLGGKVEVIAHA
jgi:large subunit ribosomal protein L15